MPPAQVRGEQRTTNGCWTCRLRKLKCDEGEGECRECSRHGITCAGYGHKPSWKDGGIREAEKLAGIKDSISRRRKASRRHKVYHPPVETSDEIQSLLPVLSQSSVELTMLDRDHEQSMIAESHFSPLSESSINVTSTTSRTTLPTILTPQQSSHREDELLMYYLDYVFALQFRHHKYAATFSSRSWLFSLVKRIKPLQHSVLSLSALHQHTLDQQDIGGPLQNSIVNELSEHHSAALSELRQFIRNQTNDSLTDNHIPILACCVQLISFDLFQGGKTEWQMHLQAATTLIRAHLAVIPPRSQAEQRFYEDKASNFYSGAILWFDILASASSGTQPTLHSSHHRLLSSHPPLIALENLMGCENSIMVLLGQIFALQNWKSNCLDQGQLSIWMLTEKARWILESLEQEIHRLDEVYRIRVAPGSTEPTTDLDVNVVTNIFACAAVVQVHQVVCGFYPSLPEIKSGIGRTIMAMKRVKKSDIGKLAPSLVWPTCVAGNLADEKQQPFFRDFLHTGSMDAHGFGNCQTAIEVLETCWEHNASILNGADDREFKEAWSLREAMDKLGYQLLLV